jgi:type I restriction enzyme S subunit
MALTIPLSEIVERSNNRLLGKHESWGRVPLGEIATVLNGFAFKSSEFASSGGIPLIRIRDVGKDYSETTYLGEYDSRYVVEPGDLLVGMDGDFNCARWRGSLGLLNQRVCKITLKSDIYLPKFLDYTLPGYLKAINDVTSSVTVKHLSSKSIEEIPLPLPPIEVQERLVAEIEKQFSRLDEAVANLKRTKANLKRYKAAVLKAAVEGKLTEAWRNQHADVEPAGKFLDRILAERREKWRGRGKYKEPKEPETSELPALPESWALATVDQLTSMVTSGSRGWGDYYSDTGPIFIRAQDIKTDTLKLENVARVRIPTNAEGTRTAVTNGDVLITITGANVTKSALVRRLSEQAFVSQHVALLKPCLVEVSPYLFIWVVSPAHGRRTLERWAYGAGKPGLSLDQVRSLLVALPPPDEQNQIVAEIERRLSVIEELEATVEANLTRADRLRQSILSRAFSGRLNS